MRVEPDTERVFARSIDVAKHYGYGRYMMRIRHLRWLPADCDHVEALIVNHITMTPEQWIVCLDPSSRQPIA